MTLAKILVVEDEVITAEVIAEQLRRLGYTVTDTVGTVAGLTASLNQTLPDLIIMDIVLEGEELDGITIVEYVRQQFNIPVVYLTAHSDSDTLERAKRTEPLGYIVKPFRPQDLRVTVEIALHKYQIEQQLIEREKFFSTILQSAGDAIITTDASGKITYLNPAAETLTGWTQTEAVGQTAVRVIRLVNAATGESVANNPVTQVLQEGRTLYLEEGLALVARDGSQTSISDSASPIASNAEAPTGVVLVISDASDRQRIDQLEDEVRERQRSEDETLEILTAERELNELKSNLIATISHEFRTPLTIILTSTELLSRFDAQIKPGMREAYLSRIRSATKRLNQLVEDVMTFSQAEAGVLCLSVALLNVVSFVQEIIEEQLLIHERSHQFNYAHEGSEVEVCLDEVLLRHVLTNLLENAVKYSPQQSTVTVRSRCDENQAVFEIQDQGIGIPTADQQQLFSPFFRASNVGTIPGTGMGLSIVKKCVDLHQGLLTVESEVNFGTKFTVTLPTISQSQLGLIDP
ncbi:MAG: response regulator [Leptolyngbyaceae cyanobacterium RM2_2_4]|nr:response regulator [Leptolyngbyaceae cyanobacterium SM1_4_3]NJO50937.1 response regulator [Leptolyngbyaceae cyanobacterium RM2_2_4]NJO75547.1 response regulator [Leptolyngbyaceae cyanobacterium RM1_406_9]